MWSKTFTGIVPGLANRGLIEGSGVDSALPLLFFQSVKGPKMNKKKEREEFANQLPREAEVESQVVGRAMMHEESAREASTMLSEMAFSHPHYREVFKVIKALYLKREPVELVTVRQGLKDAGVLEQIGGTRRLMEMTESYMYDRSFTYLCGILLERQMRREMIEVTQFALMRIHDMEEDSMDIIADLQGAMFRMLETFQRKGLKTAQSVCKEERERILKILETNEEELIGVPSGLRGVDRHFGGFKSPDLIVIAGRPAMGKSSLVTTFARNMSVLRGIPVGMFLLEMSAEQVNRRIVGAEASVIGKYMNDPRKARERSGGDILLDRIDQGLKRVGMAPIYYDDTAGIDISELEAKARKMVMSHGVKLIMIDYIQLITDKTKGNNREQEVSSVSRRLKGLAKELDVPVIVMAQLSRAVELRGGAKRPILSDLRESGAIEQDADIVCFLYRPEYYDIYEDEDGNRLNGLTELIVAKYREGATDTVRMKFVEERTTFEDYDPEDREAESYQMADIPAVKLNDDEDVPF